MEDSLFVSKISKLSKRHSNIDKKPTITFSNKTNNSHLTQGENETKTKATKNFGLETNQPQVRPKLEC